MDIDVLEAPKIDFKSRIEKIIADCPLGSVRFDNLIDLRDTAQALIDAEKDKHHQALKDKAETLRQQLAKHTAMLANLEALVRAGKRAPRADKGKPRAKVSANGSKA